MSEFEKTNFFTDRAVQDDPYPYFDWMRAQGPVWREPHYGVFVITGHQEAMAVYGDPAVFPPNDLPSGTYSSCNVVAGAFVKFSQPLEGDDVSDIIIKCRDELPFSDQLPSFDPPNHTNHRHLLMRLITPKGLKENEGSWSLKGSSSRHLMMMSLTSSPSSGCENFTKAPATTLHDEYVPDGGSFGGKTAGSPYTAIASAWPVIMNTP